MNEKLSALMDGELDRDNAAAAIKALGANTVQREDWDCYHLIGDALRGDAGGEVLRNQSCTAAIFSRLAAEPTVLAPVAFAKPIAVHHRTRIALAMAASVVTVSAIGVVAFKQQGASVASVQLVQQIAPQPMANAQSPVQVSTRVNDYLVVHRQFANPAALQEAALHGAEARKAVGQ
ncbi:MAG TPA: sigma-E factor negative regulatory protein [Usitatibacteraceae bacterium]